MHFNNILGSSLIGRYVAPKLGKNRLETDWPLKEKSPECPPDCTHEDIRKKMEWLAVPFSINDALYKEGIITAVWVNRNNPDKDLNLAIEAPDGSYFTTTLRNVIICTPMKTFLENERKT